MAPPELPARPRSARYPPAGPQLLAYGIKDPSAQKFSNTHIPTLNFLEPPMPNPFLSNDPERRNAHRVGWAERTLNAFCLTQGVRYIVTETRTVQLSDLLTNLAHFSDANGIDLADVFHRARLHYEAETEGHGRQFDRIHVR
jgi:hypothetical protein